MNADVLEQGVRAALDGRNVVLAVSGGVDSMVLMHAAARVVPASVAVVATFDHGTGEAATRAATLVCEHAARIGLRFVSVRARQKLRGEAAWRAARWSFLNRVASEAGPSGASMQVATAHTRDDQVETVAMRILRGSGARGIAALYARSAVLRPLLDFSRAEVLRYALQYGVPHVEDPSNESRIFLRNRLRRDILPELHRVDPALENSLIAISRSAAQWRRSVEDLADSFEMEPVRNGTMVNVERLRYLSAEDLAVFLPALAARAGVTMDRRGTVRLAEFLVSPNPAGRVQLSGGHEVEKRGDVIVFAHTERDGEFRTAGTLDGELRWNDWHFLEGDGPVQNAWSASLPRGARLTVRAWQHGDRIHAEGQPGPRRVKRFLSDAGIRGADRIGWPVVLADEAIVWIPGVRRGVSSTTAANHDERTIYVCERIDK